MSILKDIETIIDRDNRHLRGDVFNDRQNVEVVVKVAPHSPWLIYWEVVKQ
jgi:hypothetical protein